MLSEIKINQWLERIESNMQSHNITFMELQNLITEKRTLLKVLEKEIN